jgi:GNAT superfamily N-acetyltransferase
MPLLDVERTWLEMRRPPTVPPATAPTGIRLGRTDRCSVERYRFLYGEVGGPWKWVDRLRWPDERLTEHLADPTVEIWEAVDGDRTAGWFELQHHPADRSVEIAYFGLLPWAIGRGLGRWLLEEAITAAWREGPDRVWLHTCTLDHPAALPNYLRRGFAVTRVERIVQEVP